MEGLNLFDPSSIAANYKREQFLKEAEEYRSLRHIGVILKQRKKDQIIRIPITRRIWLIINPRKLPSAMSDV